MEMVQTNVFANYANGFNQGLRKQNMLRQMQYEAEDRERQSKLNAFWSENGEAVASGNTNVLADLAKIDGQAAYDVRRQVNADRRADQKHASGMELDAARLAQIHQASRIQAEKHIADLSGIEREKLLRETDEMLAGANVAYQRGPEALSAWVEQNRTEIEENDFDPASITFETFPAIIAAAEGAREGLAAGIELGNSFTQAPKQTAAEAKIARLMETGLDRQTAIAIADGRNKVSIDPITREPVIVDAATGQPVSTVMQNGGGHFAASQSPALASQASATNSAHARTNLAPGLMPGGDGTQARMSPAPQDLPAIGGQSSTQQPNPTVTAGGDAQDAYGIEGVIKSGLNSVADAAGFNAPFPAVQQTIADFNVMREQLLNNIASTYDRPPSWLLKEIRALTTTGGTLEGAGKAQAKLRALRNSMATELKLSERRLKRRQSPADRQKVQNQKSAVEQGLSQIDAMLGRFGETQTQQTSSGIKWRIEQ